MDKNRRGILPTIPRPSTADTRQPGHGHVRCLRDLPPCTQEHHPVDPPIFGVQHGAMGGDVLSRACLRSPPLRRASCWPLETRRGAGGWGFELTGWPMWENPGGTDVPAAGRGDVQCHLRVDCSWSGEHGSPVLLHFFLLEKTYVTGETSSIGREMHLVEQTDLVEQTIGRDRPRPIAKACRHWLVHVAPLS